MCCFVTPDSVDRYSSASHPPVSSAVPEESSGSSTAIDAVGSSSLLQRNRPTFRLISRTLISQPPPVRNLKACRPTPIPCGIKRIAFNPEVYAQHLAQPAHLCRVLPVERRALLFSHSQEDGRLAVQAASAPIHEIKLT